MLNSTKEKIIFSLFILLLINALVLDVKLLERKKETPLKPLTDISTSPKDSTQIANGTCPPACKELFTSLAPKPTTVSLATPSATPTLQTVTARDIYREIYIPLGSSSTKATNWTDAAGTEAYIDTNNFSAVKSAIFEASLRIPTANGKVYARLYNVTDQHPVWFSDVSTISSTGVLLNSNSITLDQGNKLYRVQLKTDLGYDTYLDFARIKIVLK